MFFKFIWEHYVRVVQKTLKDILTKQQQRITNQTENQPSSLYQTENISTQHFELKVYMKVSCKGGLKSTILFLNIILSKINETPQKLA
jgi:hypothetical protein